MKNLLILAAVFLLTWNVTAGERKPKVTHKFCGRVIQVIDDAYCVIQAIDINIRGKVYAVTLQIDAREIAEQDLIYVGSVQMGFYRFTQLNGVKRKVRLYKVTKVYTPKQFYVLNPEAFLNFCSPAEWKRIMGKNRIRPGHYIWEL